MKITREAADLYKKFIKTYPFICVSREPVQEFIDITPNWKEMSEERVLDLLEHFILSQGWAEDVVE